MNVNSTPPVEPGKVTTVGKSGTVGIEAAGAESSGGFFAQLHALIFGSKTASDEIAVATIGTANAEGKSAADVLIESESESIPAVEADDALANVVDIDLLSDAELSEAGQQAVQKAQSSAQDKNTSSKAVQERKVDDTATAPVPASIAKWVAKQDPASDEMASHELQRKTAQAMSDGDQLLGRLQEANQTLNKPNGKTLPIQHGQALEPQNIEQIEAKSSPFEPSQTLPEDATVPANYVGNMSAAPLGEDNKAQDEQMAAALFGGAIAGATAAQGETSTAVVQEMVADPALTASTLAKPEAALVGNKLTTQGESTSNLTNVTVLATGEVANPAAAGVENGKVTIPWAQVPTEAELASLPPELKDQLMEGGKNRPHTAHLQAQSMAQGVTPAQLAAQQAATTPVPNNPANVTSVDMAAVVPQAVMTN
ncbi:MAG: flagellar hook-length control protein FliK, partial [Vibrio sp.]